MKLVFPTDDDATISAHFGRAAAFVVLDLSATPPVRERREKPRHGGHGHHGHDHDHEHDHDQDHHAHDDHQGQAAPAADGMQLPVAGSDHGSTGHGGMFAALADCQVLIAGGMGEPAYEQARALGLEVILTGERSIATAAAAYQAGGLATDLRRIHRH